MKRLLLLALPALLAGCPNQQPAAGAASPAASATPATPATPVTATPAATAAPDDAPEVEFVQAGTVRTAATLTKFQWRLVDATDATGRRIDALLLRPQQPVTLDFRQGRVAISNTCNRMDGSYRLGGPSLTIGDLASTLMACPDPALMTLDAEVAKRLRGTLRARLSTGAAPVRLEMTTAPGDVLVFASNEDAATRYRSPGERVFLEVAAQAKPCSHPLVPNKQCLQVRELKYDEQGLRVGTPGAFAPFHGAIEGYTHEPGVRNVLRVNRHAIKDPPAGAPSQAYVLDKVIESAIEGR